MPSIKMDINIDAWLSYTKAVFNKLPIELQLVWLYEILIRTCLKHARQEFKVINDSYVIRLKDLYKVLRAPQSLKVAINTVYQFRNHFVHLGYFDITSDWNDCLCNKKSIDDLANQYEVSLNWSKTVALEMM